MPRPQTVSLDSSYTIIAEYKYDAFGNQLTETTDANPFRYCGEYYDAETGLIYLRARYYDTSVGRFISEDPIRDGLNWYVYANNNPIMFVDPWGLKNKSLRELTNEAKGQITWNGDTSTATVTVGDKIQNYVVHEDGNVYVGDNRAGYLSSKNQIIVWDNSFYNDFNIDKSTLSNYYSDGFYSNASGPKIKNGLEIVNAETGLSKVGNDSDNTYWEINTVSADAKIGITTDYVGFKAEAQLVGAEGGVKINMPLTDKKLTVSGKVSLGGIGVNSYFDSQEKQIKVKLSLVVGAGFSLGVE